MGSCIQSLKVKCLSSKCIYFSVYDLSMANSTLMFSGIDPEGRNSSKVLRPPGGGSSLGPFSDLDDQQQPSVKEAAAPAAPAEPSAAESSAVAVEKQEPSTVQEPIPVVEDSTPPPAPADAPAASEPAPAAEESQAPPAPASHYAPPVAGVRGRVPPGGHSSGPFW